MTPIRRPSTISDRSRWPRPGSMRQVLDLVGLLESIPFDPERSPWDVTLIEGLEDGRAALYLRAHHVLTDGVGGIRLLGLLLDEPDWPRVAGRPPPARARSQPSRPADGDRRPGTLTITIDLPEGGAPARRRRQRGARRRPRRLRRARRPAGPRRRQLGLPPADGDRRAAVLAAGGAFAAQPLRGASRSTEPEPPSLALGGSRNDLLVAAAAAGLGRYHERLGQPTPELRLATPDQPAPQPRGRRQLVRARPASRCRPPSAGPGRSSAWSWSGWRRPGASRRCGWRRRWRRRSGACRRGCCSRRCTPRPTPSTSPPPRSPACAVTGTSADRGSRRAIRSGPGWVAR